MDNKTIAILAVIVIAIVGVAAYFVLSDNGDTPDDEEKDNGDSGEDDVVVNNHYPVTVTTWNQDSEVVEMTFTEKPKRVFVFWSATAEVLLHFGLGDTIVGLFGADDDKLGDPANQAAYDKLDCYGNDPDKEIVRSLNPDLIIGWRSSFGDGPRSVGTFDYWNKKNVDTYVWDLPATTIDDYIKHISDLGKIFDIEDQTQAYLDTLQKDIKTISEKTKNIPDNERVEYLLIQYTENGPGRAEASDKVTGQLGEIAGGKNVFTERCKPSMEEIRAMNPDFIFIWIGGFANFDSKEAAYQHFISQPGMSGLTSKFMVFDFNQIYSANIIDTGVIMEMYEAMYG